MSDSEIKKEVSEKFVNSIKSWVGLDDKIRKLKEEIKELTNQKKEVETIVLTELDKMDEKVISITDGTLRKSVSKTQTPLKKENIRKTIFDYIKDEQKTREIIETMMKNRQIVEKINLKRIKSREPKNK
jgi:hypothetical protein